MRILLANDDGFHAPGLWPLFEALQALGDVWVCAPEREQSAQSHALTMHKPLRARQRKPQCYAISGTPADCVYLGLHGLLPHRPDLIVSGVNRGANLGNDVLYSGTVAAAMEGALHGIPAIAVSLHFDWTQEVETLHFDEAARVGAEVARRVVQHGLPRRRLLNVNVPNRSQVLGIRPAQLGERTYEVLADGRTDPRGRPYWWIGGAPTGFAGGEDADGAVCDQGYATVTPLSADLTDRAQLASMTDWFTSPASP